MSLSEAEACLAATEIVTRNAQRRRALELAASLALPDAWLAAGFVRNAVWDECFGVDNTVADIDLVFFDTGDRSVARDRALTDHLIASTGLPWSVKNQARMHSKHGHPAYRSTWDAMRRWPEKQTAVAMRIGAREEVETLSCFGFRVLFNGRVEPNLACAHDVFLQRAKQKRWSQRWPGLIVACADCQAAPQA